MRRIRSAPVARHRSGIAVAAVVAAAALLAAACDGGTGAAQDAVTGDTGPAADPAAVLGPVASADGPPVRIGQISDGKSAASDQSYELDVIAATARYLNEHQRGLAGHPIEVTTCIDDGDPAKATDCANQLVREKVAVVVAGSLAAGENIVQPLHDARIPVIYYAAGSAKVVLDKDSSFVLSSATAPLIDIPVAAAKAAGKTKVSVVLIDVPAATGIYDTVGKQLFADQGMQVELVKVAPGTADMASRLQPLASGDPGVVHILGNDTFCIAALNGLKAVGYDGPRSMVGQCLSDATRKAVPAEDLAGIKVAANAPLGTDDPGVVRYEAIMKTYGTSGDTVTKAGSVGMYMTLASLATVLDGFTGELTPASITSALKTMPQKEIPASGGIGFRCNGRASALAPAVCARGSLLATLGDDGQPTHYEQIGNTPIEG